MQLWPIILKMALLFVLSGTLKSIPWLLKRRLDHYEACTYAQLYSRVLWGSYAITGFKTKNFSPIEMEPHYVLSYQIVEI